jgi:DNA-binding MarR family transcriptional regulator/GNAT superfamily N-acetyltransferase
MDDSVLIPEVRAFNRFYTRLVGALDAGHLQTPYSLTEARVIYELATRGAVTPGELAATLSLDAGYVTRLVGKLAEAGLLTAKRGEADKRSTTLSLTEAGRAAFATLDGATNELFAELLAPIDAGRRQELHDAMTRLRTILGEPAPPSPVILRPQRIGDIGWMVHRQGILYNQQFGWNGDFEALIAGIYSQYHAAPTTPAKDLWVAEQRGQIVGSIFVMPSEGLPGSAQLRMLYVEPATRGQGVGATLVRQAVSFARANGYERMRLWTHTIQQAARRLYAAAGFAIVETIEEDNFGKAMTGEIWEMRF